jgi:hypothetical protein
LAASVLDALAAQPLSADVWSRLDMGGRERVAAAVLRPMAARGHA